jgi:hypothetical protein
MLKGLLRRFTPRNDHITEFDRQTSLGVGLPAKVERLKATLRTLVSSIVKNFLWR